MDGRHRPKTRVASHSVIAIDVAQNGVFKLGVSEFLAAPTSFSVHTLTLSPRASIVNETHQGRIKTK
jgi:hypothetical protein